MKIFISGGCKNGKSSYAENISILLSQKCKPLYYVATMLPVDEEDENRIFRHKKKRKNLGFDTLECYRDILKIIKLCDTKGTFLLDSTTALLANEMFLPNNKKNTKAHIKIGDDFEYIFNYISNIIIVSDYIYSDSEIYDEYTKLFQKGLAFIDKKCASICDVVIEMYYGNAIFHKGQKLLGELNETYI